MNVGQSFRLAIKSLLTSKARALLTMLGIIIGVAAVIVIVSLGTGMQTYMNSQFEQVGVNLIQVMVYEQPGNRNADADDFYELAEKYPQYIDSVTPALTISGPSATVPTSMSAPASPASARPSTTRRPARPSTARVWRTAASSAMWTWSGISTCAWSAAI